MSEKIGDWYSYSGAIHIHTTESDGTKPLDEVISIGQSVGLEFMMFTDHMNLINKENGGEGLYDKTLVVIGYEHNDQNDEHHYLLFNSPVVYPEDMTPVEYVKAGDADKAIGILAHPDEIRDALADHPPYPWRDWNANQFQGIEVWNQMSEWMEKLTKYNKIPMVFSPRKSIISPTDRILKKWDDLSRHRKVSGIAGVDAHAFPIKIWPVTFEIFPYKVHFRSLRTHILLTEKMSSDFNIAKQQLYDAIVDCRMFFSNMRWGEADKFEFFAQNSSEKVICGGRLSDCNNSKITAKLPSKALIKLVHNGKTVLKVESDRIEYKDLRPGVYRLEAWKNNKGWIFSNHIRVEC